jgi:hypothetical protein
MKEKRVVVLALILVTLFTISICYAAETTENQAVEKAYTCLKDKLKDKCGESDSENNELIAFNLLAIAYDSNLQSDCKNLLNSRKTENECWGTSKSGTCTIKSTAIAVISLQSIEAKVEGPVSWLLDKRKTNTGLKWFLEIDTENSTECTVNGKSITMNENKKISGTDPTGLIKAYNNYWFEITDITKNYTVSCKTRFTTSLLYQKPLGSVFYVSSDPHSASAFDSTVEQVESYCFTEGSVCNYEGSLWATLAMVKEGKDISPYLPYLSAMADEAGNKKYLPYAFLYMLTGIEDYSIELLKLQVQNQFWGDQSTKLFQTPLAFMSLNQERDETKNAKNYLLTLQDQTGCWPMDSTSFILYAVWPKTVTTGGDTGTTTIVTCESKGNYCVAFTQCKNSNVVSGELQCGIGELCCKTQEVLESCSDQAGAVCNEDEECDEPPAISADSDIANCCKGNCLLKTDLVNQCENKGSKCKSSCSSSEQIKPEDNSYCSTGEKCCAPKPVEDSGGANWLLIILLIILIILVILAILFRNQLKVFVFRVKNNFSSKKGPESTSRPLIQPQFRPGPSRPAPPRQQPVHMYGRPGVRPQEKDKDFDETMKKLRDMSK